MKKFNYKDFAKDASEKEIDIFISSSSFEDRCFIIPNAINTFKPKETVFFYNKNEVSSIIENAKKLQALTGNNSSIIELDSNYPVGNFLTIDALLNDKILQYNKPNILIDSTTFTHETLLVLIRLIHIKKNSLGKIYFAYVVAKDYSINSTKDEEKWLSKGIDQIRTILGYSGFTDPTKKNHLILLFGFESERTKRIIEEYEYDFITLGFGGNFTMENHLKINYERHCKLVEEYPNARKFTFSLLDPIEAKKQILEYLNTAELKDLNTVIAPLNNKISTIGAGLAAIENRRIQLAYAKPNIYNTEGYSSSSDEIYFDQIDF